MTLTTPWPNSRRAAGAPSLVVLWLVAGLAMTGLAACVSFLRPEGTCAIMSGLLVLLLAAADLRWAFLAFVILYPFLPNSWGIDVADWMPYLSAKRLCCLALAVTFLPSSKEAFDTPQVKRIASFLLGLIVIQALAGFGSHDLLSAVKQTFGDAVELYLPFLIGSHLFRTKAQVRVLVTVMLIAMAVVAVLAIVEHTIDYNFYSSFVAAREDIQEILTHATESYRGGDLHARRVRVAFNHPIELGLHLMCIFFVVVYLLRERKIIQRAFLLASLPLFTLAMLYTYSRGPLLGLVCGLVWLAVFGKGTRGLLVVLLVGSLGGYLLMPAESRDVLQRTIATSTDIDTGDSIGGGTVRARLEMLQAGLQFSQENIWFGLGPSHIKEHKNPGQGAAGEFVSVDNFYLQVLLRHGVIVLALTVGFYLYLLALFTRAAVRLADREVALLAAIGASMCFAYFVALTTVSFNVTLFWILLGPALRMCDLHQPWGRRGATRRRQNGTKPGRELGKWTGHGKPLLPTPAAAPDTESTAPVHACVPSLQGRLALRGGCAAVALLALLGWGALKPCQASPSFYGTTGLFATPVASVGPRGAWSLGSNYVGRNFRPGASSLSQGTVANFFTLTILPRLELTAVLTNYEGKVGARDLNHGLSSDFNLGGYTVDRTASLQWLALTQHGLRPALAFGLRDFLGRPVKHLQAQYAVMSMNRGRLTLSAGLGTLALRGPFGGAEYVLTRRVSIITEGLNHLKNGGLRVLPLKDVQLDLALMGFRSLGGGLSYRRHF
jgi:O-antigen ligase